MILSQCYYKSSLTKGGQYFRDMAERPKPDDPEINTKGPKIYVSRTENSKKQMTE